MNLEEAKKYYEATFKPKAAELRLANWLKDNPQAPKAKKAEEKKEE
jgi:hypothetical protein